MITLKVIESHKNTLYVYVYNSPSEINSV